MGAVQTSGPFLFMHFLAASFPFFQQPHNFLFCFQIVIASKPAWLVVNNARPAVSFQAFQQPGNTMLLCKLGKGQDPPVFLHPLAAGEVWAFPAPGQALFPAASKMYTFVTLLTALVLAPGAALLLAA